MMSSPERRNKNGATASRKVYLATRIRPFSRREHSLEAECCAFVEESTLTLVHTSSGEGKAFVLDFAYDSTNMESDKYASNKTIFSDFGPLLIQSAFASISSCLFITGAPGSGKTHTMIGRQEDPGILPRLMEHLYLMIKQQPAPPPSYLESRLQLEVSYYEIMNEQVHDLFSQELYTQPIKVRETKDGRVFCEGLIKVKLQPIMK
jgi:hypothetical protein